MANVTNHNHQDTLIVGDQNLDNSILNYGTNVTIRGGGVSGQPIIRDYIENHGTNVTIQTSWGNDEIQNYAARVSMHGGAHNDNIFNYVDAKRATILGGTGDDSINNLADNCVITGGDGDDIIRNYGDNASIETDGSSLSNWNLVYAHALNVTVNVNGGNDTVSAYAGNGTVIRGGVRDDRLSIVRASASNGGVVARVNLGHGNDTIIGSAGPDIFQFTEDNFGEDVIIGYDESDTIELLENTYRGKDTLYNDVILYVGFGSITIKDAVDQKINLKTDGVTTFSNVVDNRSANVVINGSDGDDSIKNNGSNVVIHANYGNDTIINSAPFVTINAGGGVDMFVHNAGGSATVYNYAAGEDRLQLTSANISGSSVDGDDVLLFIGNDTLTFADTNNKAITVTDTKGRTSSHVYTVQTIVDTVEPAPTVPSGGDTVPSGGDDELPQGLKLNKKETTLTIKKPFSGTVDVGDYSDAIVKINASSNPNAVEIIGNDNDNVIKASKGGSTLDGADGNDTLTGGNGNDLFIFDGEGNDVIKKYKAGKDKIYIDGEITDVSIKGSNVILTVEDEGTLTVKSVARKRLTIIDYDDVESTYIFTKQNNDLDSARVSDNNQLPSYWFDVDAQSDPLDGILDKENISVDLNENFMSEVFKPSALDQITTAKHRQSKL